jgi:hypothetical protein
MTRGIWWFPSQGRFWMERTDALRNARVLSQIDDAIYIVNPNALDVECIAMLKQEADADDERYRDDPTF